MLTDAQRVELALPARIMWAAARASAADDAGDAICASLAVAAAEPLSGLHGKAAGKMARRVERAAATLLAPHKGKTSAAKVAMTGFYFTEALIAAGALELYEGSPMADATSKMLGYLDESFGVKDLDNSAKRAGRRMVEAAQSMGLYRHS